MVLSLLDAVYGVCLIFYKALLDEVPRYASIVTMSTDELETRTIGDRQSTCGEKNSMLSCIADRQLSTGSSKLESGRVSYTTGFKGDTTKTTWQRGSATAK